ncbi:dystroglycan-like [Dorcoceras hygrometricum]|uniref:Dystroglycan-like n=1 Tax=Dorcoceras hygrometricum TaxID=472368 RepID=A0A2Z7BEE3_9LAMI|nr:dystroglycan-like [Dorcoceras hygrometricum]
MASAYYSNTQHIDFEYVLAMDDPGMVSMFQALMASGLEGFLGCPAVIYEAALVDFFENASVRDVDGLSELSEIPKDVVFDARSIVSMSGEPVSLSGKKSQMKIEYRLLCDIMAKSNSVKAGSFNAITVENFSMLTAVVCGVRMNWASVLFTILKKMVTPGRIIGVSSFQNTKKTVHRYVSLNDKVGAEEAAGAPKPKAASKKRPAAVLGDEPVVKKKRTMKKKSSSSKVNFEIVAVAQEAVPIQMVEPTTAAPAAEDIFAQPAVEDEIPADPPADEVAGETVDEEAADEGAYDETADVDAARVNEPASEPAVADIVNEEPFTADDVDVNIEQVLADTAQIKVDEEDQVVRTSDLIARWDAERIVTTPSDMDGEIETERAVGTTDGVQTESFQPKYIVEEPGDMEMSDDERSVDELIDVDEKMYLDEIILTIPAELSLPSAKMEVTKITIGKEIKIRSVDEKTWYLARLPQIPGDDKGKEPLQLKDPIKGKLPQEHYSLICADIDLLVQLREKVIDEVAKLFYSFSLKRLANIQIDDSYLLRRNWFWLGRIDLLVQLRDKVIDEVAKFFYSFSLKRLANIQIEDSYFAKEELVLSWEEAESTGVALQRKMYILLKYRAVLVRKYLDGWILNFVPGEGDSAVNLKVIDLLSDLLSFVLEELKQQAVAYRIRWDRPCCSILFEGRLTSHRVIPAYTIFEVSSQHQYDDTLPLVSEFFKLMKKIWAGVCIEAANFFVSGRLLPVGSINFCRSLSVDELVYRVAPLQSPVFALRVSQFCTVFIDYSLFSRLTTEDIRRFVGSIALERTVLRSVQIHTLSADSQHVQLPSSLVFDSPIVKIEQSSAFADTDEQMDIDLFDDSSLHFDDNDAAAASISLPAAPIPNVTEALAQLRASIEQISKRDDGAKHKDTLLLHLHDFERQVTARFDAQDRVLRALRKDSNDQRNLMSLDIKSSHKHLSTQIANTDLDVVDVRRVVRENHQELNAKITSLEEQVAATRHDLLEFSAQAQQTLNVITDQLSKLVAYINRGGNDKKGEVVSSSRPPPDDQNRGSGNTGGGSDTVRTTEIPQRDIDNAQRNILERLMSADRARERERRSKSRSSSYKRR